MTGLLVTLMAAAPDPALLDRLEAHTARLGVLEKADGVVSVGIDAQEFDGAGTPKHHKVLALEVTWTAQHATTTLKRLVEDGEDLTAKKKAEVERDENEKREKKKNQKAIADLSPFSAKLRGKYDFEQLPAKAGETRIGFQLKGKPEDELMVGVALVDAGTGELQQLTLQPAKLPALVDSLAMVADFGQVTSAGRSLSRLEVRGVAGLPLFKKHFTVTTTFSRSE